MSPGAFDPWLDKRKLAEHLSCSVRQLELWIVDGMPHAILAGRVKFQVREVLEWLEANGHLERRGTLPLPDERRAA